MSKKMNNKSYLSEIDRLIYENQNLNSMPLSSKVKDLCKNNPELEEELRLRLQALQEMDWLLKSTKPQNLSTDKPHVTKFEPGAEPIPGVFLKTILGQGGFGEVWEASHPLYLNVAIKILPKSKDSTAVEKKTLEWLQAIEHPNLLKIFDLKETDDFVLVIMELADGTLLEQARKFKSSEPLPLSTLKPYMEQAAEAIDFLNMAQHGAENQGIQHRDIKPQNLLLVGNILKIGDFGLARLLSHTMTSHTGTLTLSYAPPEFFDGKTFKQSDQYSLACTYYQLATGRLPFEGSSAEIVAGHLMGTPNLNLLPLDQQDVLMRALSKKPQDRWENCKEFVNNLEHSTLSKPILSRRVLLRGIASGLSLPLLYWGYDSVKNITNTTKSLAKNNGEPWFIHKLTPQHHIGPVREIALSLVQSKTKASRNILGISNGSKSPAIWNIESGTLIKTLGNEQNGGACAAIAPFEFPTAVTGADTKLITLWNLDTASKIHEFKGHQSSVNSVCFSRDGSKIASCACDGLIKIWDTKSGEELETFSGETRIIYAIAFGPTGKWVVTGSWDGKVQLYDLTTKEKTTIGTHLGKVWRILAPENSRTLISSGTDGFVKIWDIATQKETHSLDHPHEITGLFLLEQHYLIAAGSNKVYIYSWPNLQKQFTLDFTNEIEAVTACANDSDFFYLATGTKSEGLFIHGLPKAQIKS